MPKWTTQKAHQVSWIVMKTTTTTTKTLPITWSSEHNWLVPKSTIKGNQKYFGPWLFLNQLIFFFFFRLWKSQNQIMWSHKREISPFHRSSCPLFLPMSVRSEVVLDLSRTLLRISSGCQLKQVTMKGVLEVTRREAIVTSIDLETFSVQPWEFSWYAGLGTLLVSGGNSRKNSPYSYFQVSQGALNLK